MVRASASAAPSEGVTPVPVFDGKRLPAFGPPPAAEPITAPTGALAPMYHRLAVRQRVAFLTMDDGQVQLPTAGPLMAAAHIPFTMFLIGPVAAKNPPFFQRLASEGGVIEDHTLTHPSMRGLPYATQRHEICGARDLLHATFHITPRFFRPPYGNYDDNTLRAVHDCGLQAAFDWTETVNNGKVYYQTAVHRIEPGDIILMHFRPAFVSDVTAALTAIHQSGLTPALLENYVN
ncbi:polysaccharide deacetylase family protein [Actinoplanes subtropicus]|uniref:polysaccharide deacetylase family protein n=1 Tax=Actinoplanes subtropicus TaxID=543632 RepID=UPI000AB7474D|nr:polysaccharide deacetylase family protein [Actinoplanes subtropicus]